MHNGHSQVAADSADSNENRGLLIGRNLVIARYAAGISQQTLADMSGLSRATIAKLETDKTDPRISTLALLAQALEIPIQVLLATPEVVARYVSVLDNCHDIIDMAPDIQEEKGLEQLSRYQHTTGIRKATRKAIFYAERVGFTSKQSRIGAAVFNSHYPGIGAAIGAYCFQNAEPVQKREIPAE